MMKKGLWIGLAVCSLAVMTACGNEAKETAAAPTESAVTQQAAQVEKPEAEAAVETAAEQTEPSDMSEEPQTFTDADKQLVIDYVDQVEPTIDVAQSTMINLSQSILAWQNYEIEDEDLRKSLVSSNTAFTLLEYEAS
ncbi:hypothetical protein [Saccharibacillus qingshengii]|uniref:hypothetical protein n=1 Tax=Saccharibacillus qingshengii TaxID=1763540 RepID=UPI001553A550|nr:hypothetical protein [Saccharibacillus qingshengii]